MKTLARAIREATSSYGFDNQSSYLLIIPYVGVHCTGHIVVTTPCLSSITEYIMMAE